MKTVKPGIRLKANGRYVATKSINRKRHYREFVLLRDAIKWKNEFHPLLSPSVRPQTLIPTVTFQGNGKDNAITLGEVFEKYQKGFLESLSRSTVYKKNKRMAKFGHYIFQLGMCQFNPEVITNHLESEKLQLQEKSRRFNFDKELKDLSSVFNWYRETIDFTYSNPVTKVHFRLGKIKEIPRKTMTMSTEQLISFFNAFEETDDGFMFQTLAINMFFMAGRIQEAAALNDRVVDFSLNRIRVCEKIVWIASVPNHHFGTKTGEVGVVEMDLDLAQRLLRLKKMRPKGCTYFYHRKGKPLRYNLIRERFNAALLKAGLIEFTATNFLRHSMATLSRQLGGLDVSQAMLRHKSARMSEHYAKLDVNKKVSGVLVEAGEMFRTIRVRATNCDRETKEVNVK